MRLNEYIFCCEYYHNHFVSKNPIGKFASRYTYLLYHASKELDYEFTPLEPKWFKRAYERNKDEALKTLEDNIKYCENKCKQDANIKERRRKEI